MLSALMTVYNGERFIRDTIDSILNQTYSNFELVIVDDGSTDKTVDIINQYTDKRIKFIPLLENIGVGGAIAEGLKHVSGKYIAKVDADDIYMSNRFELQLEYLEKNPDIYLVDSLVEFFPDSESVKNSERFKYINDIHSDHVNSITASEDINEKLYWFCCITHSTSMYRRELLDYVSYNADLRIAEDYSVFYKINKLQLKMYKLPYILGKIRISDTSATAVDRENMLKYTIQLKEELFIDKEKIYIWGTGELGRVAANYLINMKKDFIGFIDSNESQIGKFIERYEVFNKSVINENIFIIVASSIGKFEIAKEIESKGYKHLENYMVIF